MRECMRRVCYLNDDLTTTCPCYSKRLTPCVRVGMEEEVVTHVDEDLMNPFASTHVLDRRISFVQLNPVASAESCGPSTANLHKRPISPVTSAYHVLSPR